jgi:hypothetical protein
MENINFQPVFDYIDKTLDSHRIEAGQSLIEQEIRITANFNKTMQNSLKTQEERITDNINNHLEDSLKKQEDKILKTMDVKFAFQKEEIISKLDVKFQARLSEINTNIANLAGQVQEFKQEFAIVNPKIIKLERWTTKAGSKIGLPYNT